MHSDYCTVERDIIVLLINSLETSSIEKFFSFQKDAVLEWNPYSKEATKLMISPIFLRNEIKIDDFGIAAIEFLCLVGMLHE